MEQVTNVTDGLRIIHKYDPEATVEQDGELIQVILDETKANINDEDADRLYELGWSWADREVWLYDPNGFC